MIQLDGAQARVSGSMTIAAASELLVAGREAIAASAGGAATGGVAQTFDLSAVTEVDSAGLAVMFAWLREAKSRNVELTFCNLPRALTPSRRCMTLPPCCHKTKPLGFIYGGISSNSCSRGFKAFWCAKGAR